MSNKVWALLAIVAVGLMLWNEKTLSSRPFVWKHQPSLTGNEVVILPDGTTQKLLVMPVTGQVAPYPPGSRVDIPSMEPIASGFWVTLDGRWAENHTARIDDPIRW